MKKIYILFLICSSLFVSCDDYLDIPPKNVITVQDKSDIKMLVGSYLRKIEQKETGTYNLFMTSGPSHWGSNRVFRQFEDDVDYSGMFFLTLGGFEKAEFKWKSSSYENSIWNGLYSHIGNFNLFLYEIEELGDTSIEMNAIKAEVLMNRALYYFRLVQYFCPYREGQYVTDPQKYGLPIIKGIEDLADNFYPARLSQKETYDFILNDLKAIEELDVEPVDFNLIYNKRTYNGLMAELYMWKAESPVKEETDWENARTYASKSMEGSELIKSLDELKALFNPFAPAGTAALRFTLPNSQGELYKDFYNTMWDNFVVYDEFYNTYDTDDIRRDFYINPGTKKIVKYELADEAEKTVQPLWRVAEMQLIIAESYMREGDKDMALNYLNEFKQTRIPSFTTYTETDVLDEILRERRKEFLCETNYRWCDMKRNGVVYSRTNSKGETETLESGDYRYSFIIPSSGELEENPNNFQNPGWDLQLDEE